ncbi:MAG: low temperature requirement protein A [Pseudorhodobacter sp.]
MNIIPAFSPRDPHEIHRAATPLELMIDLAAVIAIAAAAHGLAHDVGEAHFMSALLRFGLGFFIIWWAWMNYTWFASAYDDNSTVFRVVSMFFMFGALVTAAGIDAVFAGEPIWLGILGYVLMRLAMVVFWLGAAKGDPERSVTAKRYAAGIAAMQVYWVLMNAAVAPDSAFYLPMMLVGIIGELAVPVHAERHAVTTWHRHHIIERYGLLNIIVLGECFIAIVAMVHLNEGSSLPDGGYFWLASVAAIITFSLWGVYFTDEDHLIDDELRHALLWGYGHFFVFAAGAAVGAGFIVVFQIAQGEAHVSAQVGNLAVAIPVAVYLLTLWIIRDRLCLRGLHLLCLPGAAFLVLIIGAWWSMALEAIAAVLVVAALTRRHLPQRN